VQKALEFRYSFQQGQQLAAGHDNRPLCVKLRLSDCAQPAFEPEMTIARAVASFYEDRTGLILDPQKLIERFARERILVLVNGDNNVGSSVQDGLQLLKAFLSDKDPQRYRFLITLDQNVLRVSDLPEDSRALIVQPMR
jgi:hypothetical protein